MLLAKSISFLNALFNLILLQYFVFPIIKLSKTNIKFICCFEINFTVFEYREFSTNVGLAGRLILASWILSYGAEHLSMRFGAKFVGRTLLSVATTLPEIAIVIYAASVGLYEVAIGAGLGSNILMMTLGLALMLLIATTRLIKSTA